MLQVSRVCCFALSEIQYLHILVAEVFIKSAERSNVRLRRRLEILSMNTVSPILNCKYELCRVAILYFFVDRVGLGS